VKAFLCKCRPEAKVAGAIWVCGCCVGCPPKRVEPPNGLDDAPPKPPKPAGALAGAAALLKLNGAGLAAVPPNADPLKLKAELLAAPNGGVEAPPPKAGVLKPANNEPEAAGWLCGAALALAKLKAEEEAPKRPVEMCPKFSEGSRRIFDEVGLNLAFV
jgi:hypothetical protein